MGSDLDAMTLADLRKAKADCEQAIIEAIQRFTEATGFSVDDVRLGDRVVEFGGGYAPTRCWINMTWTS